MSHGDSPDGFVFPPFIPPAAARPSTPPAAPAPRPVMPWDVETPIVAHPAPAEAAAEPFAEAESGAGEDLPWLEPRAAEAEAPAADGTAAEEEFPGWLTWDARDEADVEAELRGTQPLEGIEEFAPGDDFAAAEDLPAAERFGAAEEPAGAPLSFEGAAEEIPFAEEDAFLYGEPSAEEESPRIADVAELELEPGYGFAPEEESGYPAAAEAPHGFAPQASEDPFSFPEPESAASSPAPFVADEEAVMASEPDPSTRADIDATEADEAPQAAAGGASAFDEVAARLEEIARMLRERPDELLPGRGDDPLALLVTGYVMGYGQGRRG